MLALRISLLTIGVGAALTANFLLCSLCLGVWAGLVALEVVRWI